jgi:hypothetical protein
MYGPKVRAVFSEATGCRIITMAALLSEMTAGEVVPEG